MLKSQLETLEEPTSDEWDQLVVVNIDSAGDEIVGQVQSELNLYLNQYKGFNNFES